MLVWITVRVRKHQSHVKGEFKLQKEEVITEKKPTSLHQSGLQFQRRNAMAVDVTFRRDDGYRSPQMVAGLWLIQPNVCFSDELSLAGRCVPPDC